MPGRAALALIALLVLAWSGVLLRDLYVGREAKRSLAQRGISERERERSLERLEDARLLNPDVEWKVERASHLLVAGLGERAAPISAELVREEPENLQAWSLLRYSTSDRALAGRAAAKVRRLDPLRAR